MSRHRKPPGPPRGGNGEGGQPPRPGTREYWRDRQRLFRAKLEAERGRAKRKDEVRNDGIWWRYIWRPPYWWATEDKIRRLTIRGFRRLYLGREDLSVAGVAFARPLSPDVVRLLLASNPLDTLQQDAPFDSLTDAERVALAISVATYVWTILATKLRPSSDRAVADGARQALRYLREYPDFPLDDPRGFIERAFLFTDALSLKWRDHVPPDCRGALTNLQALGRIISQRVHALPFELPPGSWTHLALSLAKPEKRAPADPTAAPKDILVNALEALDRVTVEQLKQRDRQRYGRFYDGMARLFPPLRALNWIDTMKWYVHHSRSAEDIADAV